MLIRPSIWDAFTYKGYVLAADMTGGFYSYRLTGPRRLRLGLRARFRRGRLRRRTCAASDVRLAVVGRDVGQVRRAEFLVGRRRVARDRRRPFRARVRRSRLRAGRINVLRARLRVRDGRLITVRRRVRACAKAR
jgi:hypothetical protein